MKKTINILIEEGYEILHILDTDEAFIVNTIIHPTPQEDFVLLQGYNITSILELNKANPAKQHLIQLIEQLISNTVKVRKTKFSSNLKWIHYV